MKFTSTLLLALIMGPTAIQAAPMQTCSDQSDCLKFTISKVGEDACSGEACEYEICMRVDQSGSCVKTGSISHTCEKDSDVCISGLGFSDSASTELTGIGDGYTSCQIVPPGGVAEFLMKDGNARDGCGSLTKTFAGSYNAVCDTQPVKSCTGNGNVGKECRWQITAPVGCGNTGGGGGDPHFKKWDGHRFAYHGECDLVLLRSQEFADNAGLDLHIRTTIKDFYSFIESAVLRIGDSVLEISPAGFWIDGAAGADKDLPMSIAGYTLNAPTQKESAKVYRVDLNADDYVLFQTYKFFLSIDVSGDEADFENSVGLLGDFYTGDMVGRDGSTRFESEEQFGAEWQVQADEPMLFRDVRSPQLPNSTCNMPTATMRKLVKAQRSLEKVEAAEEACRDKGLEDFKFCVSDVLTTGDVGMAGAW